ncbi:MAG: hypothetical protein ABIH39_05860, partial [Candidatus Margulisiibacteriota bacterium]
SKVSINIQGWMISTLSYNLTVGMVFAFVYTQIEKGIKGDNPIKKGLAFGFLIWMIGAVPALMDAFINNPSIHMFLTLNFVTAFVGYPLVGAAIALLGDRYCKD